MGLLRAIALLQTILLVNGKWSGENRCRNWSVLSGENRCRDTFKQKIDHVISYGTWNQSYFVDLTYWDRITTPVVFLYLGGEEDIIHCTETYNFTCNEYLNYFNAICVQLKHRFYDCDNAYFFVTSVCDLCEVSFLQSMTLQ